MIEKNILDKYIDIFQDLNVDKNRKRYSAGKAPHKPLLLLSIIILHKNDRIDLRHIESNLDLRETWSEFWECLEYESKGPIYLPFYHLRSDGFWNIEFSQDITPHQPKSLRSLNEMVKEVSLDEDLIELIDDEDSREELVNALLNGGYFSKEESNELASKIKVVDESFEYEEKINELVEEEFVVDHTSAEEEFATSRDPAFRRSVLNSYDERCAVCGLKIVTSSGISVIDAAHILPYHKFKNDDLRNGLALCKRHHWLFDQGLISLGDDYRVKVSKSIEVENPREIISRHSDDRLKLPKKSENYPPQIALNWHKQNIFV